MVAFIHFLFIVNSMLGYWVPNAYVFYNILFIISLFWTLHCKESVDAIHTVSDLSEKKVEKKFFF